MDKKIKNIMINGFEIYESLMTAIHEAGGTDSSFSSYSKLSEMTVIDLFSKLATNNIRFIYKKERK